MKEDLLSYIWRYKLWGNKDLETTKGQKIEILNVGSMNKDAGPDYFNAKIRIDGTVWAGNIEIHVKSSDWFKHKHQYDKAYNNIILHIVQTADMEIKTQSGQEIPQLELAVDQKYIDLAEELNKSEKKIACAHYWDENLRDKLQFNLNSLVCERLEQKVVKAMTILGKNKNDWEETFYQLLAQSMGMKVNQFPFQQLTLSLPLKYIGKHKDNLLQVESMLLGQAGLLENLANNDEYIEKLKNEYKFLRSKFDLLPIDGSLWKFARMRPANSPYLRISELAMLLHKSEHLFRKIIETKDFKELHKLFSYGTSEYWNEHYMPNQGSKKSDKHIGTALRNSIIINCVAPMVFAYGKSVGNEEIKEQAIDLLEKVPAENNNIVEAWSEMGVKANTAYDTQALIQLRKEYCDKKDCLRCKLGIQIYQKVGKN